MLRRFSLYGFLKNQQYYDPFMVLAFLQMGLSFTMIGLLIGFREVAVIIMEVPTGAIADLFGRRKSMILSFASYIVSFATFGSVGLAAAEGALEAGLVLPLLLVAMFFFAVGDAFRTGTHKAMIFTWLRIENRTDERTKVYGYTRSWSKIGSAVSVVLACIFVFATSNFIYVFFFSIVPYILNIVNFLGYPPEVDGGAKKENSIGEVIGHLREALAVSCRQASLRRLIFESMGFEGFFKASKEFLYPILKAAAIGLTAALLSGFTLSEEQRTIVLLGPVLVLLYVFSAVASRKAHVLVDHHGHEDTTAKWLWGVIALVFLALVPGMYYGVHAVMIAGFVALYIMQNLWRPVLISRFDAHSDEAKGATVLSIESLAKSTATMIFAPLLGFAVDTVTLMRDPTGAHAWYWPVGVGGAVIALGFFLTAKGSPAAPAAPADPGAQAEEAPVE